MGDFRRTKRPSSRKISSQSRYDHFDTAPHLSQHQHLGKRGELMGRTSKNIKLRIPEKPHKIKGFRSGSYRVATTISSAAPSTTRTTLRVYFRPVFFPEICSKIRWRENRRDGKKYSILRFSVLRNIKENQGDEIPSFCRNFESFSLRPLRYISMLHRNCFILSYPAADCNRFRKNPIRLAEND